MGTFNYSSPNGPVFGINHLFTDVLPYSNEAYQQAISKVIERSAPTGLGNVRGVYIDCSKAGDNKKAYDKDPAAQEWHNKHAD